MAPCGWPDWAEVEQLVKENNYIAGNEAFSQFRKKAIARDSEAGLKDQAVHAPMMWDFLVGFGAIKVMYRKHIVQVFNRLMQTPEWVEAWEAQPALHARLREMHEDLQAALGLQSDVLQKTISAEAQRSMARVPEEERPERVRLGMAKDRLVDQIELEGRPSVEGEQQDELAALQDGIDEAVAIQSARKMESDGARALRKLRVGCIRCAGLDEPLRREAGRAHEVFSFLLSYARRRPSEVSHVAEVLNQLMRSPSWAATLQASQLLRDDLQQLPVATQASLGLQHEKLLELVNVEAQEQAASGVHGEAEEVAEVMRTIQPPPSDPVGNTMFVASLPPPAEAEWKVARTPEGHRYYVNMWTGESLWERPACLGGPPVYREGDEVQIWSKSKQAWGRGTVIKVVEGLVAVEFTLPGGLRGLKELRAAHRDLRPYEADGWTEEEQGQYGEWFDALPLVDGEPELRKRAGAAAFLRRSGLSREVLVCVSGVGHPNATEDVDFEAFASCCRLVAHCQQLLAAGGEGARLVSEAERPLRSKLRTECLPARPPNGLATFDAPAKMGKGQGASVVGGGRGR